MIKKTDIEIRGHESEYDIVILGADVHSVMRKGFEGYVAKKYPYVKKCNQSTRYGDRNKLGTVIECKEEGKPTFVLMYIMVGNYTTEDRDVLLYDKLEECLKYINVMYRGNTACCTLVGTNTYDGCGDKAKVEEMFNALLPNLDVTIYIDTKDDPTKRSK